MSTTKVSVTVEDEDLTWLRRRAKRVHGGNLSAAFAEGARLVRRQEALREFLTSEKVPMLTPDELEVIRAEWRGVVAVKAKQPAKKRAKKRAR